MKFGTHVSIAAGLDKAPKRANDLGCECFQLFTRSPRGGQPSRLDDEVIENFLSDCKKYDLDNYYVHTPYFINLASLDNKALGGGWISEEAMDTYKTSENNSQ